MNREKSPVFQSLIYRSIRLSLLCGLTLLVLSCEKNLTDAARGEKVAVKISVNAGGYGAEEVRSYNPNPLEAKPSLIPLGDNLFLLATLTPDRESLRATAVSLDNGQKIRLVAYNTTSGSEVREESANYVYSSATSELLSSGAPLLVTVGQKYRFAAFAYDKATIDAYPSETNIDPSSDLLWGLSAEKTISTEDNSVNIVLARQFAQVQVDATTGNGVIKAISNVQINGGKRLNTFNPWNGSATLSNVAQAVSWPAIPSGGAATIYGNARTVYPVSTAPVEISIGSITINGGSTDKVFSNYTAHFDRTLVAGTKYTLTINVRRMSCGTDGVAGYQMIGSRLYQTHEFGTGVDRRCWMVQNSMEGTPSSIAYGMDANGNPYGSVQDDGMGSTGKVNGYYYTQAQASGACPTGWHVPTYAEAEVIIEIYSTSSPLWVFWSDGNYSINAGFKASNDKWTAYGVYTYWWVQTARTCLSNFPPEVVTSSAFTTYWCPVRCVQNI
jgi:hypothetical protein